MAKKKDKYETYEKEILEIIKKNNLFVIKDIFSFYTGVKSAQFYNLELEKSESIKKAIDDNKIKTCQSLKNKWFKSDNPTLQIALFKTICTEDERRALSQSYIDQNINHSGEIETRQIVIPMPDGSTINLGKYKGDQNKSTP